ncbi:hypothetical protein P3372_27800, partial [Vibrio parahaemolyticus]|nr:hypothetical protein [Vibrio parahaemolyticus]
IPPYFPGCMVYESLCAALSHLQKSRNIKESNIHTPIFYLTEKYNCTPSEYTFLFTQANLIALLAHCKTYFIQLQDHLGHFTVPTITNSGLVEINP